MSATPFTRRKFLISTAAAASSAWFVAACSGGETDTPAAAPQAPSQIPQSEIDAALNTETTLTFWTWVPDIQNEVKLFTTKYPKIKVNVTNLGNGAPHYQKLRTAIQAGQGAPDVAQVEFQYINSFTLAEGDLLDLTPYAPPTLKDSFPAWVWSQVNTNGGLWGIPQDTGPMGLLYREDLLQQAGLEAPKTYDDFAAGAQTYHSKNPKSYLVNVAPNEPGQFVAYLWQAGVRPFSYDGQQTVKVDLASDQAKTVAKFWGDLVTSDTASNDPTSLTRGTRAWPTASTPRFPSRPGGRYFCRVRPPRRQGNGGRPSCRNGMPPMSFPATGAAPPTLYSSSARIRLRPRSSPCSSTPTRSPRS
jgi:multiple sugar transport system substrate-binding protein